MGERRPNLRAVPNRTDSDTAKNLPVVGTNIVLVTPIPAAMIVAMVVVMVMVMVMGVLIVVVILVFVFVFVFVLVANLDQVGKIQRSERRGLRYRQGPGCRGGGEGQGGCRQNWFDHSETSFA
jgi:Flp pilus assembly protein TadB